MKNKGYPPAPYSAADDKRWYKFAHSYKWRTALTATALAILVSVSLIAISIVGIPSNGWLEVSVLIVMVICSGGIIGLSILDCLSIRPLQIRGECLFLPHAHPKIFGPDHLHVNDIQCIVFDYYWNFARIESKKLPMGHVLLDFRGIPDPKILEKYIIAFLGKDKCIIRTRS